MSRDANKIELRIGRLTVDQEAAGGLPRADLEDQIRAAITQQLAGGAPPDGTFAPLAAKVAVAISEAMPSGIAQGQSGLGRRAGPARRDTP